MESALSWTLTNANHHSITVLFCRDSKSLCEALISSHPRTLSIHNSINSISSSILIQWIPGHFAILGNDLADKAAKEATTIATDTILPISLSNSIQAINETFHDAPPTNERVAAVYKHRRVSRDAKQINNRKADVLIARLQSGDRNSLKQYLQRLNASQDPTCPNCCQEEQDLLHWLPDCLVLISVRQRVFVCHQGSLEWLTTRPGDVVAYARNTLINLHAQPNNIKWLASKHTHTVALKFVSDVSNELIFVFILVFFFLHLVVKISQNSKRFLNYVKYFRKFFYTLMFEYSQTVYFL